MTFTFKTENCTFYVAFALAILLYSNISQADAKFEFKQASMAACEKLKKCAFQQMEGEDIPPEMRQMVQNMAASMCTNLISFEQVEPFHDLYLPATKCMQSMANMSCEDMGDDVETPACREYEKLAKRYIDDD